MTRDDRLGLDAAAAALFDEQRTRASLQAACEALHAACLSQLPPLDDRATALPSGHALSPADAATCLLDPARTAVLVRALDAHIAGRHARFGEVRVLYAGCGPLAPLALLLARRWRGRGVRFDLLDVHACSIESATRLFELAGAADTLGSARCADAATLQVDARRTDILVTEVMQRALIREPQVAVVANLLPQCAPHAALVPGRIEVRATLARAADHASPGPIGHELDPLLTLSADTVPQFAGAIRAGDATLPEVMLQVPRDIEGEFDLMLATCIEAGPGESLVAGESGLTEPLFAFELGRVRAGDVLGVRYRLGRNPGFSTRRIGAG